MKIPWPFDLVFDVNLLIRNVIRDAVYIKENGKVEGLLIIISKKTLNRILTYLKWKRIIPSLFFALETLLISIIEACIHVLKEAHKCF